MYREIKPDPRLEPFVKCFWIMERDYGVPGAHEVVWPDGKTEVLFLAEGRFERDGEPLPLALFIGPLTQPIILTSPGKVRLAGVRFWPWGFWPFWKSPVNRLRDRLFSYAEMTGPTAGGLQEQIASVGINASVPLLEQYLLTALDEGALQTHPLVAPMARQILDAEEALSGAGLEQRSGVSVRHLERLFQEVVGLTPKKLGAIARFDRARRALFRNPRMEITEAAHLLGYYDLSHFIRDFRANFGMTPGEFKDWTERQRATIVRGANVDFVQAIHS